MAIIVDDSFYNMLRYEIGNPSGLGADEPGNRDELSDAEIEEAVEDAVMKFQAHMVNKVWRQITTVADQQQYDAHANTIRVEKAYILHGVGDIASTSGTFQFDLGGVTYGINGPNEFNGLDYFENPSLYVVYSQKLQSQRRVGGGETWKWWNGKLWIIPPPTKTGNYVWYESIENFTLATMRVEWRIFIKLWAKAKLMRNLARKRNDQIALSGSGQPAAIQADVLLNDAAVLEGQFETEVELLAMKYRNGIA